MKWALFLIAVLGSRMATGQAGHLVNPEPIGGLSKLALVYYKINFTKEQRKRLEHLPLEFIFDIDAEGKAELEKVNGTSDRDILDSLFSITPLLPRFTPLLVDGEASPGIFFMQLEFPSYENRAAAGRPKQLTYINPSREDFELLEFSGRRTDMLIGGVVNTYAGRASQHLSTGGGVKLDLLFTDRKGWGYGLALSFYANHLKKDYPIVTSRDQSSTPGTMLIGILLGRDLLQKEKKTISLQLELCYALQNVVPKENDNDEDFVQFNGFSPGIVGMCKLRLGKDRFIYYYQDPVMTNRYLNLHAALRPLYFSQKVASGLMFEFGIAYRIQFHFIESYRLKD